MFSSARIDIPEAMRQTTGTRRVSWPGGIRCSSFVRPIDVAEASPAPQGLPKLKFPRLPARVSL